MSAAVDYQRETLGTKSAERFPLDADQIDRMDQYRKALDEQWVKMAREEKKQTVFMEESRRLMRFINQHRHIQ